MSRFDYRTLTPAQRNVFLDGLAKLIGELDSTEQVRFFLERLLTESEVVMLARRMEVAKMLVRGKTYEEIRQELSVGKTTIQSVDGWLTDVADEYRMIRSSRRKELTGDKEYAPRQSAMRGSLEYMIENDSRMILFRFLLS